MDWDNKSDVIKYARQHCCSLVKVSPRLRQDKEVVLAYIHYCASCSMTVVDPLLRDNEEIVLAAINKDGNTLANASDRLKNDREIVLAAVKNKGYSLEFANPRFIHDREIVLAAVKNNGHAIAFASQQLQDDYEILFHAVNRTPALNFASDRLKNNRELVIKSVTSSGITIQYASEQLQNDPEIVLIAAKEYYSDMGIIDFYGNLANTTLKQLCEKFCNDVSFMRELLKIEVTEIVDVDDLFINLYKSRKFMHVKLPRSIIEDVLILVLSK